jgi:LytTR family transcriptional regulator, CO-responsive transcriptional regulator RcoM
MDPRPASASPLYLMERFDVGIVQLDAQRHVVGMNDFARRVLPVAEKQPFDRMVLDFHPERSQPKVEFLLDQAAQCPVSNPPPMTMIINIPERVLLIKVSRLSDAARAMAGYTLVFYDITELVSADDAAAPRAPDARRRLLKIPTVASGQIALIDVDDVRAIHSDGHYTRVLTTQGSRFCNLSIGDIEARLDPERFMRVHRSHIVNLHEVEQLQREEGRLHIRLRGDETPVPVSRSSSADLLERLGVPSVTAAVRQG